VGTHDTQLTTQEGAKQPRPKQTCKTLTHAPAGTSTNPLLNINLTHNAIDPISNSPTIHRMLNGTKTHGNDLQGASRQPCMTMTGTGTHGLLPYTTDCTSTRTYDTAGHSMTQTKPEGHHTHETPQVRGTDTCGDISKISETDRNTCASEEGHRGEPRKGAREWGQPQGIGENGQTQPYAAMRHAGIEDSSPTWDGSVQGTTHPDKNTHPTRPLHEENMN